MPILKSKKTNDDDWESTVKLIDIDYAMTEELEDPFLNEYEKETGNRLPASFEDEYDKYIFDDRPDIVDDIKHTVIDVYKFKKNIYYSEDGRRINITGENREEMNRFQYIRRNFENIEELYNRTIYSYKNLINFFLSQDDETNPNTTAGAFLAEGNMFIDYLDQQWIPHYIQGFHHDWKQICSYIYKNNLGYRLCYNLRNFDQHPQDYSARQIIKEAIIDIGENRVEYYLNVSNLYKDLKFRRKMKNDIVQLRENNIFSEYARNYIINITSLYNLALTQFLTNNVEVIREVYGYLIDHKFNRVMIKSVDDRTLKIKGTDYADDVISTVDIDNFLHIFKNKGIINKQEILDIRNGNKDTPDILLTSDQISKNVIIHQFLGK